jgi:hypothetical protein
MGKNSIRKYNSEFRKKLVNKFENIKDKNDLFTLYNIIYNDIGSNISSNRNGIFINMNILSDNCIKYIIEFIDDKTKTSVIHSDTVNYKVYKLDDIECLSDKCYKLSNQEKNIIKRIRTT